MAVVAAQASGQLLWAKPLPSYSYSYAHPRLSLDGQRFYFEDVTLDVATGAILVAATSESADRYVVGGFHGAAWHLIEAVAKDVNDDRALLLICREGPTAAATR